MTSKVDFTLSEQITISAVAAMHEDLEALIARQDCDKVVLKAAAVKRVDTAGMQLLLAFVIAVRDGHISLTWNKPSKILLEAASVLGLQQALGLKAVQAQKKLRSASGAASG